MKILALCDSPTLNSGFARVAQNLFKRWNRAGAVIDVWGIAFLGWGYKAHPYINQFFPAGTGGEWCSAARLQLFLSQLQNGGYTHVWIMQDTFQLSNFSFPQALRKVCTAKKIRSMLYFPVDAPLESAWTDIIAAVDVPVAYTQYGKREAERKAGQRPSKPVELNYAFGCEVLPHGVDTAVYRPLPGHRELRGQIWKDPWLGPDDFLILNVNAHQRRKDVSRSLEILAELKRMKVPAKLVLHMPVYSDGGAQMGVNLELVAQQLGLVKNKDWGHHDEMFYRGQGSLPETATDARLTLCKLYNAADLCLSTSLGEGWGLAINEALACGTAVALPGHTSCGEIASKLGEFGMAYQTVVLPIEHGFMVQDGDNSRGRPRVDLRVAALLIEEYYHSGQWKLRPGLNQAVREWLSWDRIAAEMLRLMKSAKGPEPANSKFQTPNPKPQTPKQPVEAGSWVEVVQGFKIFS